MVSIESGSLKHSHLCNRSSRYCWFWGVFVLVLVVQLVIPNQNQHEEYLALLANPVAKRPQETTMRTNSQNGTLASDASVVGSEESVANILKNEPAQATVRATTDKKVVVPPASNPKSSSDQALLPIHRPDHKMPKWMLEYFEFHREQRAQLNETNWSSGRFQFLIMRCLHDDRICGGTSDRLQSLPYQLLMAQVSKRILLILWQRPFPLEEFLLPPQGGLDWRVPSYMKDELVKQHNGAPITYAPNAGGILTRQDTKRKLVVWTRDQTHNHGSAVYDRYHEGFEHTSRFAEVFHDAWRMVLTPSPPVAVQIAHWMNQLGLVPGEYASTHVRALYAVHNRSIEQIEEWTHNALHCTTQLRPEGPFLFASDSTDAQTAALAYGQKVGLHVVSRFHETEPLHMDGNATGHVPQDYYDVLVDLYLLGNARALAYNVGGYGKLGLIMGFDHTAGIQHQKGGVPWARGVTGVKLHKCDLKRPQTTTTKTANTHKDGPRSPSSFFVPSMESPI